MLDWEFAFSGSPLTDVGNMLRFSGRYPPGFADGFIAGYREAGGPLPPGWRETSEALDLYALADFLTRPPEHPYFGKAVSLLRKRLARAGRKRAAGAPARRRWRRWARARPAVPALACPSGAGRARTR